MLTSASLLAASALCAQSADAGKGAIKISKIAGNVYLLQGTGGNMTASIGDDGIVLIDDESASLSRNVEAALASLSKKPLRCVVNTHYHEDHVGGNAYFLAEAPIIAQENVRKLMESGGITGNGGSLQFPAEPQPKGALPILTYEDGITLHLNGEDIRVVHFPSAHTDGDSIVFFPKSKVVHMGDIFVTHFPFVDVEAGGSLDGMIDAVEKVIAQVPEDTKVIPGHGPLSARGDLIAYLRMLHETRDAVEKAMRQGQTLAQMKQERLLDPWKGYAGEFVSSDAFLETIFLSLTRPAVRHD